MIINKVSELRKEKNITQGQLANELGVSRQTIISLEDNKSNISLYFAMKISKFFNKPIEQIFIQKDMINYFNNTYWGWFDGNGWCVRSCQVSCQQSCQLACQSCQHNTCHNQHCGI